MNDKLIKINKTDKLYTSLYIYIHTHTKFNQYGFILTVMWLRLIDKQYKNLSLLTPND